MKQLIFRSKLGGWYIYGTNYKYKQDVAYCNLFFPKNSEPMATDMTKKLLIDIQEAKFTSYKNKLGLTIFKYEQLSENELNDEVSIYDKDTQEIDTSMMGGEKSKSGEYVDIKSEDLPFY